MIAGIAKGLANVDVCPAPDRASSAKGETLLNDIARS
jgi:hypothetical protein